MFLPFPESGLAFCVRVCEGDSSVHPSHGPGSSVDQALSNPNSGLICVTRRALDMRVRMPSRVPLHPDFTPSCCTVSHPPPPILAGSSVFRNASEFMGLPPSINQRTQRASNQKSMKKRQQ